MRPVPKQGNPPLILRRFLDGQNQPNQTTRPSCPHPQKGRTSNADTEKTLHTGGRFRVHNKLWVMRSRFLGCAAFLDQMVCPVLIMAPPPVL